jgi:hypothetical protein
MNKTISPFANESELLGIGDLTIDNRTDRISIYGSIDLTRDKAGLEHARMLNSNSQFETMLRRCGDI